VAERREASHDPLYSLQVAYWAYVCVGHDFLCVCFDSMLGNDEPNEHALGDHKTYFLGLSLMLFALRH